MSQERHLSKGEIYIHRLLRGSAKAVPVVGDILDEVLFGVAEEINEQDQASEFRKRFESIQNSVEGQTLTLAQVLVRANAQVKLLGVLAERLDELLNLSCNPIGVPVTTALQRSANLVIERIQGALPPIWNVPHLRNPYFTGRKRFLEYLHTLLTSENTATVTQAIAGLGGIGKTQLVTEYIYRHASEYNIVWWVQSEEITTLASDYASLAADIGLPENEQADQKVTIKAVRRWLESNTGWLLILDNAVNAEQIRDYLPRSTTGNVLITSRNQVWGTTAIPLSIEVFDRNESIEFLLGRTRAEDRDSADSLAEALGDLPLALEQAAAYIEQTNKTISAYLQLFQRRQVELMNRGIPDGYPNTVATTWDISFNAVEYTSPKAANLLRLFAFLSPQLIPITLLVGGKKHLPEQWQLCLDDEIVLDDAISTLRHYSLIEASANGVSVHRLVQSAVRTTLTNTSRKELAQIALNVIRAVLHLDENDPDTWMASSKIIPHALSIADHTENLNVDPKSTSLLLTEIALYFRILADFDTTKTLLERALSLDERNFTPDHPQVAASINNLGYILRALGDLKGAKEYYQRALDITEKSLGSTHHIVAAKLNNLGRVLKDLGELEGAHDKLKKALIIKESVFGPNHPEVAISLNNLGSILHDMDDLEGARENYERALRIDEKIFGSNHPNVSIRLNNLGALLQDMGDLLGAFENIEKSLKIEENVYGPAHPNVAYRLNNLGIILKNIRDFRGAYSYLDNAFRIFQDVFGDDHPNTRAVRQHLESLSG